MADADDEDNVLGIPVCDPDVLKASQFVLATVGVTAFLIALEIVQVIEQRGLKGLSKFEVIWRLIDTAGSMVLVLSGYLGVKRSSRSLLCCLFVVSLLSIVEALLSGIYDITQHEQAGAVVLQFASAVFFVGMAYYAHFLWTQARMGVLLTGRSGSVQTTSYSLLGIPMMDLKVLKATQVVFTSLGIIICILGSVIVVSAEVAITNVSFRTFWIMCLGIAVSLSYTGYFGVKRSSAPLLGCFVRICAGLCAACALFSAFAVVACGFGCTSFTFFCFGVTWVSGVAVRNAQYLRARAAGGVVLTVRRGGQQDTAPLPVLVGQPNMASGDVVVGVPFEPARTDVVARPEPLDIEDN